VRFSRAALTLPSLWDESTRSAAAFHDLFLGGASTPGASALSGTGFAPCNSIRVNTTAAVRARIACDDRLVRCRVSRAADCSMPAWVPDDLPSRRPRKARRCSAWDLTTAIDAAYRNIGRRDNVHLIQADIFALPFRAHTPSIWRIRSASSTTRPILRPPSRASPRRSSRRDGSRSICTRDMACRTALRTPCGLSPRGCRSE
jgi:hypothetical protein